MTFSEAATTAISEASTNTTEMIEEFSQLRGPEVSTTNDGGVSMSTVDVAEGS